MNQQLSQLITALNNAPALLSGKKVAAGFDGFVDSIVKVVNNKTIEGITVFFQTIKEFGNYISAKSGSGFSLESEELVQKLGGNMPIMSNALGALGASVSCVGAFGVPALSPAFAAMHPACSLYSFTNPGFTTAMEFADGKIMLAQMTDLNHADWNTIDNAIGLTQLKDIFLSADLICLVNWSELEHSNAIWQGLLKDVFSNAPPTTDPKQFFFDLSDCSKRSSEAITTALKLIAEFGRYGKATLSLNRNEAGILYRILVNEQIPQDLGQVGKDLFSLLKVSTLIIHTSKISLAWDVNGNYVDVPQFIDNPLISTGAGDNFNAGYCLGSLLGLDAGLALILANSVSNCYINTGESPAISTLVGYLSQKISASL
ncbi:hypothetical protein DYU05_07245 [Mucilaginibacter terrenus]|uniref:Carbohydrate kinase PfkB domain-containing protein n=1 Tax=Mucilaginibacter terrenus TaxID=2482727 RepID=A0A3E2NWJ5_9SPHI|nr:hypothetical protein [Mucilaginibacter terrenus]RFZ85384.1 hypothetical protein DYU05_07245 [Mucilaginibacter terrenus]